jgi:hypothetical protein
MGKYKKPSNRKKQRSHKNMTREQQKRGKHIKHSEFQNRKNPPKIRTVRPRIGVHRSFVAHQIGDNQRSERARRVIAAQRGVDRADAAPDDGASR